MTVPRNTRIGDDVPVVLMIQGGCDGRQCFGFMRSNTSRVPFRLAVPSRRSGHTP